MAISDAKWLKVLEEEKRKPERLLGHDRHLTTFHDRDSWLVVLGAMAWLDFNAFARTRGQMVSLIGRLRRARSELSKIFNASRKIEDICRSQDQLADAIRALAAELRRPANDSPSSVTWVPPGHFYSPIVDPNELRRRQAQVFDRTRWPSDLDLREASQLALLDKLAVHYTKLPFSAEKREGIRYRYDNTNFSYGDAIVLACLLMDLRPKRVLEIGSGWSSCVILDTNERLLHGETVISFVEPFPDLLYSLMMPGDREKHSIIATPVQDISISIVDQLTAGDILFIDSTHVSKAGSDVHFEFFQIFPRLKPGVYIHVHDIYWPFEYPEAWFFDENRSWNEAYLMRAFLSGNAGYEIVFFNDFMAHYHKGEAESRLPLFTKGFGCSFWFRKL
jgi:hypothetical protein